MLVLSKGLGNIQRLIVNGSYSKALNQINDFISKKNQSQQDIILATILKGLILNRLAIFEDRNSRMNESITYLSQAIKESQKLDYPILLLDAYIIQLINYYHYPKIDEYFNLFELFQQLARRIKTEYKAEYKEAQVFLWLYEACNKYFQAFVGQLDQSDLLKDSLSSIKKALKRVKELEAKELLLIITYFLYDYIKLMHLDQLLMNFTQALKIADEIKNNYWKAELLYLKGRVYLNKGEFKLHIDTTMDAMSIDEENGNEFSKVARYWSLGTGYSAMYENSTALEQYLKAIELIDDSNNTSIVRACYHHTGIVFERMGQLDKALEYYQKAQTLFEEAVSIKQSYMMSNIASIHVRKGDLDKGLEIYKELLDFYSNKVEDKHAQIRILYSLMGIYWFKGEIKKAIDHAQRSLNLSNEIGRQDITRVLYSLVLLAIDSDQMDLAQKYLEKRKSITSKMNLKIRERENDFLEAYMLKEKGKVRDIVRAELIFEKLLTKKLHYFLKVDILISLCEILMLQASTHNDATAIEKANKYLNELHKLAVSNEIPYLTVESLWLQSKLSLIKFDIGLAHELISKALEIAKEKGLKRLKKKIQEDYDSIQAIIAQLRNIGKTPSSIKDRMSIIDIQKTIKEVKKQRILNTSEEEPILTRRLFTLKI